GAARGRRARRVRRGAYRRRGLPPRGGQPLPPCALDRSAPRRRGSHVRFRADPRARGRGVEAPDDGGSAAVIDCQFDASTAGGGIVLRPNRSWTWRANLCLAGTLLAVSGTIGVILAAQGLWTVLPFAMLQGAGVLACLYYCVRRTHVQEVLTF